MATAALPNDGFALAGARDHIIVQKRANAAAQRGGVGRNAASDPSKALPALGYTVLGPIAAGAFSTILRCKAVAGGALAKRGEVVAIKSYDNTKCAKDVDEADARDREFSVLRTLKEASVGPGGATKLHPHLANMLVQLGSMEDLHVHAVLQYCEGGSLKRYLETPGLLHPGARDDAAREGMAPPLVAVGTRQLASALGHMHSLGICHRDVKPANILLESVTNVSPLTLHLRLCDFGFACICGVELQFKEFNTPMYAAPEIASPADCHRGYLGRPVDMWALGCVLYEMLHLMPAFKAEERFELEGLIRNCNWGRSDSATARKRVPTDARALMKALLAPVEKRLTADQVLTSAWIKTFGVPKSQEELDALKAIPSWWCDVAKKGCLRPKDGAYPPQHECWRHGDYMVCEKCYAAGTGVKDKHKLKLVDNPLRASAAVGIAPELRVIATSDAYPPPPAPPSAEPPPAGKLNEAAAAEAEGAEEAAAEEAAAEEAAAEEARAAKERMAAMELELAHLKKKHGCDSRLEAGLRELNEERAHTRSLRAMKEELTEQLLAARCRL